MQQAGHVNALGQRLGQAGFEGELAGDGGDAFAVAAGVGVLGVDGAGEAVQQSHHQAVHVVEEHGVFEIDRRFVGDRVEELAVLGIEIAGDFVECEEAAEDLVLPLKRDGKEMLGMLAEPMESFVLGQIVDEQRAFAMEEDGHQFIGEAMNGSRREAEGAVEHGLLALGGGAAEGDAHALHAHDFQNIEAGLLEEVVGAAVDSHAAADLVDQAEFFVGVGELSGEGIEFAFEAGEANLVAQHVEKHAGLPLHGLIVEGGSFLGLLIEPDAVEAEAAADADDIFAELEGRRSWRPGRGCRRAGGARRAGKRRG